MPSSDAGCPGSWTGNAHGGGRLLPGRRRVCLGCLSLRYCRNGNSEYHSRCGATKNLAATNQVARKAFHFFPYEVLEASRLPVKAGPQLQHRPVCRLTNSFYSRAYHGSRGEVCLEGAGPVSVMVRSKSCWSWVLKMNPVRKVRSAPCEPPCYRRRLWD